MKTQSCIGNSPEVRAYRCLTLLTVVPLKNLRARHEKKRIFSPLAEKTIEKQPVTHEKTAAIRLAWLP